MKYCPQRQLKLHIAMAGGRIRFRCLPKMVAQTLALCSALLLSWRVGWLPHLPVRCELATLSKTQNMKRITLSIEGASFLRVLQLLMIAILEPKREQNMKNKHYEKTKRCIRGLELLRQEHSQCISMTELQLDHNAATTTISNVNPGDHALGVSSVPPLSLGTQRFLLKFSLF